MTTKQEVLTIWKNDPLIKDEIKIAVCELCNKKTICQHQNICLNCITDYSNLTDKIQKQNKDRCSMCGNKNKLVLDSNTCKKCLNNFC